MGLGLPVLAGNREDDFMEFCRLSGPSGRSVEDIEPGFSWICTKFLRRDDHGRVLVTVLVVGVLTVADGDDQDEEHLVLDLAKDAIIAHPIAP